MRGSRVAKLLQDFGDLEAAEPLCREQVEGRAKALGENHTDTLEAINNLAERYQALGKRLHLRHLSEDCRRLLDRAGDLVEVDISEDPHYHVLVDRVPPAR